MNVSEFLPPIIITNSMVELLDAVVPITPRCGLCNKPAIDDFDREVLQHTGVCIKCDHLQEDK